MGDDIIRLHLKCRWRVLKHIEEGPFCCLSFAVREDEPCLRYEIVGHTERSRCFERGIDVH